MLTWRLFLRLETTGRVWVEAYICNEFTPRHAIACKLWQMRRTLRDTVDAIDLKNLGVTA